MTRYARDPEAIARDLVVVFQHPEFEDVSLLDGLAELKRLRRYR